MPYRNLGDGLYLMKQPAGSKGVDHYGILDVGDRMGISVFNKFGPVLFHQSPPAIRGEWFEPLDDGGWVALGRIADDAAAARRLRRAMANPEYHLLVNNCEHFARFVATGRRESSQLQNWVLGISVAALGIAVWRAGR